MRSAEAQPMEFAPRGSLTGAVAVAGDKSISHRALMLSALAVGKSRISGLSEGKDVLSTAAALRAMGALVRPTEQGVWEVEGVGVGGLVQPDAPLDMGNSGTSARLLLGLTASHRIHAVLTGDFSLRRRPMDRMIAPLRRLGAEIFAAPGGRLPLTIRGVSPATPLSHRLDIASAQVKSGLLLAGLNASGCTEIFEPVPTRDHSERMLELFGANIEVTADGGGGRRIVLRGEAELAPCDVEVPGDPSSAAFLAVAALIVPGSDIRISGVGVNPMRTGLFAVLRQMGGDIAFSNERTVSGELFADLRVRHSPLRGVDIPPELVPAMIDEFPIFFIAAAFAKGESSARSLAELRVKESDRIGAMARGLAAIGAEVREQGDGLLVRGSGGDPLPGGATIVSEYDHRVAMSFAVAGLRCDRPVTVDDMTPIDTSFPGFAAALAALAPA